MSLLQQFSKYIKDNNLFSPKDKLLLAVSGGVDSVVLCELCKQAGFDFTIVHKYQGSLFQSKQVNRIKINWFQKRISLRIIPVLMWLLGMEIMHRINMIYENLLSSILYQLIILYVSRLVCMK